MCLTVCVWPSWSLPCMPVPTPHPLAYLFLPCCWASHAIASYRSAAPLAWQPCHVHVRHCRVSTGDHACMHHGRGWHPDAGQLCHLDSVTRLQCFGHAFDLMKFAASRLQYACGVPKQHNAPTVLRYAPARQFACIVSAFHSFLVPSLSMQVVCDPASSMVCLHVSHSMAMMTGEWCWCDQNVVIIVTAFAVSHITTSSTPYHSIHHHPH